MDDNAHGCADAALAIYEQLLGPNWLEDRRRELGISGGGGLFSSALTIWLGIRSRLEGGWSVESTWLSCSQGEALRLSPRSSRAKSGVLSPYPSGYDYARRHLLLALVIAAADRLFEEARALLSPRGPSWYLLDGSSLTLNHSVSVAKAFPPATNQHGPSHWPVAKLVLAHDLSSGLSIRAEWGPMYGSHAVSEQYLAHKVIERIPSGSGVIADRGFGLFQIVWALRDRPMLVRLTDRRARSFTGTNLTQDLDVVHVWTPSATERKGNPDLPADASVAGRVVVRRVLGPKGQAVTVCLFTNDQSMSAEELVALYIQRWNIETDLRSLKHTVGLEIIRAQTPEMVVQELILSVAGYNLVRTVMALSAQSAGVEPRRLSFARACACIQIYARRGPATPEQIDQMMRTIAARKLTQRNRKRSFAREVWKRSKALPSRKVETI
jgi:putative transposase